MYSLHSDFLSQTLFIFYLLTSHSLKVLSGGGLVTKSCLTLVTPWTVASEVPLSMGFSRQEYWSGLPFPSPGDLSTQGLNLCLPHCRQTLYHLSHQGSPLYRELGG